MWRSHRQLLLSAPGRADACRGARPTATSAGPHRLGSRGIGLLDALIALAILSFGLLALTQFQSRAIAQTTESQSRQVATQMGDELLSTVLVDVSNAACYTLPQVGTCASAVAKSGTTAWQSRVAAGLPGTVSSGAVLDTASGRFTVTINWTGKASADARTLQVTTDVRP